MLHIPLEKNFLFLNKNKNFNDKKKLYYNQYL